MTDNSAQPAVKVTLENIYKTVLDIDKKIDPIPAQVRDHELRLRVIEKRMWVWLGGAALGGGGLAEVFSRVLGA